MIYNKLKFLSSLSLTVIQFAPNCLSLPYFPMCLESEWECFWLETLINLYTESCNNLCNIYFYVYSTITGCELGQWYWASHDVLMYVCRAMADFILTLTMLLNVSDVLTVSAAAVVPLSVTEVSS